MDMQNVSNLQIPEGVVRTIHDKDSRLIWGRLAYDTKYAGGTEQDGTPTPDTPIPVQVVTGEQTVNISDGNISEDHKIDLAGKNLFNTQNLINNWRTSIVSSDNNNLVIKPTANGSGYLNYAIPAKPSTDYTISLDRSITGSTGGFSGNVAVYSFNGTNQSSVGNVPASTNIFTFTTASDTIELRFYFYSLQTSDGTWQDVVASYTNIQLEEGQSKTSYAPYYNYELCKIGDYQDYIYKSGEDWYVHKDTGKLVLDGSNSGITWSMTTVGSPASYCFWFRNYATDAKLAVSLKYCDYFTYTSEFYNGTAPTPSLCENDNTSVDTGFMFIFKTDGSQSTTTAGWQTWLASHNITVYYLLQTPTDTQITNSTLISQLDAIHEWLTRYGYNATVTGNLPIIIDRTNL